MIPSLPTKDDLLHCNQRISSLVHQTPILTSSAINELTGVELFFKCENFQKMGAFKMRGATNAILNLSEAQREKGVVTHSSGNFAQAVSLAAKNLGVKASIVMPSNAPQVKKDAVLGYGGVITISEPTIEAREFAAKTIVEKTGATFLHPSNDIDVIIGNSTAAIELFEMHDDLDYIVSPIGGGGLIAGTALAAYHFSDHCKTVGAEPAEADDAYRSFKSGTIERNEQTNTIADGLRTHLGSHNFPIIQTLVEDVILVEENEIINALQLVWERLKIVIEPSSAVALASIFKEPNRFSEKKVGIIFSGGNVDLTNLPF